MPLKIDGSAGLTFGSSNTQLSSAKIGQVVVTNIAARYTNSATSFTAFGPTISITPKSVNSRILLLASLSVEALTYTYYTFSRSGVEVTGTSYGIVTCQGFSHWYNQEYSYVDSPNTTSAITYSIMTRVGSGTLYLNDYGTGNCCQFMAMEILP